MGWLDSNKDRKYLNMSNMLLKMDVLWKMKQLKVSKKYSKAMKKLKNNWVW